MTWLKAHQRGYFLLQPADEIAQRGEGFGTKSGFRVSRTGEDTSRSSSSAKAPSAASSSASKARANVSTSAVDGEPNLSSSCGDAEFNPLPFFVTDAVHCAAHCVDGWRPRDAGQQPRWDAFSPQECL